MKIICEVQYEAGKATIIAEGVNPEKVAEEINRALDKIPAQIHKVHRDST